MPVWLCKCFKLFTYFVLFNSQGELLKGQLESLKLEMQVKCLIIDTNQALL